jgi:hypothetical protein
MIQPSRFVSLALFVAAAFALLAGKAEAQANANATPLMTAYPAQFFSGDTVTVSGSGFPVSTGIVLWLDINGNGQFDPGEPTPIPPFAIQTKGDGTLSASFPMNDVPAGLFLIQAGICASPDVGLCFGATAIANIQVTITLGVSTSRFGSGTHVAVTGYGFPPNSSVNVWYDSDLNGVFAGGGASTTSDQNGAFSLSGSNKLLVQASPGKYFIHAGVGTIPSASIRVEVGSCWFQECIIDGADTLCFIGNSPSDLGSYFADCKQVDTDYTEPTPVTQNNNPPGGYDFNNVGPTFLGAGVLAAATAELGPPGTGCAAMTAAIIAAEGVYGNSVPDKVSLEALGCSSVVLGVGPLEVYIGAVELSGNSVPDKELIEPAVAALNATGLGVLAAPLFAQAAVAGAVACGYVNYYCHGSDITATILDHPDIQIHPIPITLLQPPIKNPSSPNPCVAAGTNQSCWGDLIGWAKVACTSKDSGLDAQGNGTGVCERPDGQGNFPQLAVPGSAGSPGNGGALIECATGKVLGLSIGYDGDLSFDLSGPDVVPLVNYHNFLLGPGGTPAPNGIDIEIPVAQRPLFMDVLKTLRPGLQVKACGHWVADMHMLWNELHPLTSLSIVPDITYTGATSADFNDPAQVQARLTSNGNPIPNEQLTFTLGPAGPSCSAKTDPSGNAACPLTPTQAAGPVTLTTAFLGDSNYGANSIATPFTVTLEETAVAITASSATSSDFDDAATVQAQLTTDGNPFPANAQITFVLGSGAGSETCQGTTDPNGFASCLITPNQQAGAYTLTASFAGNAFYAASSASASFTITKEQTTVSFTASSPTVIANNHVTTFSATLKEDGTTPIVGRTITISIGSQSCSAGPTDATGTASCSITLSQTLGPGTISASFAADAFYLPSSTSEAVTVFAFLARGAMAIGNLNATVGNSVTFWGSQWSAINSLTGGLAPSAMKGYADGSAQNCGASWTGDPGASGNPPPLLPSYMGVVVSSTITMQGSTLLVGDTPMIVVVRTNPGYGPAVGQAGTGTVVAVFCHQ